MLEPLRSMLLVHQGHADQTAVSITSGAVLRRTHAATVVCSAVTSTLFRPKGLLRGAQPMLFEVSAIAIPCSGDTGVAPLFTAFGLNLWPNAGMCLKIG